MITTEDENEDNSYFPIFKAMEKNAEFLFKRIKKSLFELDERECYDVCIYQMIRYPPKSTASVIDN